MAGRRGAARYSGEEQADGGAAVPGGDVDLQRASRRGQRSSEKGKREGRKGAGARRRDLLVRSAVARQGSQAEPDTEGVGGGEALGSVAVSCSSKQRGRDVR